MSTKEIFKKLNIFEECRKYQLPLWQCPQFLFVVLGLLICITSLLSYLIGTRYVQDPATVALIVLFLAGFLLVIDFLIVRSFERLAEANRMKSEFISVVSHELRSPLSNFSWALDVLADGDLGEVTEEQAEYFTILKENVDRMKQLVSDLLVVSRIQTASLPLDKEEFSLVKVADRLVEEFEPFARASHVEIKVKAQKGLPEAWGDPKRTALVVKNLLDNALKYTKKGKVEIRMEKKKEMIRFEIQDTGLGIPEEEQKFIFKKFFRAKNAARHETQGSGLGLFISKSIIEESGGEIGFKSKEGKGTTFWFTLPIKSEG